MEIPQLESVVANDFSKDAYTSMCKNVEYNSVGEKVLPSWREARYGVCVLLPCLAILWLWLSSRALFYGYSYNQMAVDLLCIVCVAICVSLS